MSEHDEVSYEVHFRRTGAVLVVPAGSNLLDAARDAGLPLPSSCEVGGCLACKKRLVSGEVWMREPNGLPARQREAGWILTCLGQPRSDLIIDA